MQRRWRSAAGTIALIVALCAACGDTVDVLLDCASPDGQYIATFFMVRGSGVPGFLYTRLTLRRTRDSLTPDSYILQLAGGYDVRLAWLDARRLLVEFPDDARTDVAETQAWAGERFEVTYAPIPGKKGLLIPSGSVCLPTSRVE